MARAIAKNTVVPDPSDPAHRGAPSQRIHNTFNVNDTMLIAFDQWRQERTYVKTFEAEEMLPTDHRNLRFEHYVGASHGFEDNHDLPIVGQWIIARLLQRQYDDRPYGKDQETHDGMIKAALDHLDVPLAWPQSSIQVRSSAHGDDRFDHHRFTLDPSKMFDRRDRIRRPFGLDLLAVIWDQDPDLLSALLPDDDNMALRASRLMGSPNAKSCNGLVNAVSRVLNDDAALDPFRQEATVCFLTSALPLSLGALEPLTGMKDVQATNVLTNWRERLAKLAHALPEQAIGLNVWSDLVTRSMSPQKASGGPSSYGLTDVVADAIRWKHEHQERLVHPIQSEVRKPSLVTQETPVVPYFQTIAPMSPTSLDQWFEKSPNMYPSAHKGGRYPSSKRGVGLDKDLLPGIDGFGKEEVSEDAAFNAAQSLLGLPSFRSNKPM